MTSSWDSNGTMTQKMTIGTSLDKGKIALGIQIRTENFEKSLFSGSNRPFCGFTSNN
jgi:hypothetical protein